MTPIIFTLADFQIFVIFISKGFMPDERSAPHHFIEVSITNKLYEIALF